MEREEERRRRREEVKMAVATGEGKSETAGQAPVT